MPPAQKGDKKMTVRDAVLVLKTAKALKLGYGANSIQFDKDDPLMMDAYGDYAVAGISGSDDFYYEIDIAMRPVREGGGC